MDWFKRSRSRERGPTLIYATKAEADAAKARAEAAGLEPGYGSLKMGERQYIVFRGNDPEKARKYLLDLPAVTEKLFYYVVETPDGNWGKDVDGLYLENLRPWQLNVEEAEYSGVIVDFTTTSVIVAARGTVDNFVATVACGKCSFVWYDGLRYQNVTAVRCPGCGALNNVDSGGIIVDPLHSPLTESVVVEATGDPDRASILSALRLQYEDLYRQSGELADLDKAIDAGEQALAATPSDAPAWRTRRWSLGGSYRVRHEHTGSLGDLERAFALVRQAVEGVSEDDPDRAAMLSGLGLCHLDRFLAEDSVADIDQAIRLLVQALKTASSDDPNRAALYFNLGVCYRRRYGREGGPADLDKAVELHQQAVKTGADHSAWPLWLSNLGAAHQARYRHSGLLVDLREAIEIGERAVAAYPEDHAERPAALSNLGSAYYERSARSRSKRDLDHAIALHEAAVSATPLGHPDRPGMLANLGGYHRDRYELSREAADLDKAIVAGEQAVTGIPVDAVDRPGWLSNLAGAYHSRYDSRKVSADLDHAVALFKEAVATSPEDHPNLAALLCNLGIAYRALAAADGTGINRETLSELARKVSSAVAASPADRARAGRAVGLLAHTMGEHRTAVGLLDTAVAMLPSVTSRYGGWADRENRLGNYLGLAGDAVAAHCAVGDPTGAVEAAELSRGILLAAHLDSRADLTELDRAHPELAARLREVREHLGGSEDRPRWWAEHDDLLTQIRRHPGFTRFLLPPRLAELRRATAGGAMILVNGGTCRSDAIIVTAEAEPQPVPLPDLMLEEVRSRAGALLESTIGGSSRPQEAVTEILNWLWDSIVARILDVLPPTVERVWWMPTGLLGLFPLHAAGHPGRPGALDRVISSYTPTLRALAHVRSRPPTTIRRQLTVALADTPGLPDLPHTVAEAADLQVRHPGLPPLHDTKATTSAVLTALPTATWAHFACHARMDMAVPSAGGLELFDGTLPIPDISGLHLADAELAYLSACSTAHRGIEHAEESINLASAFHMAGFRHVIASMWPLADSLAFTAARAFYDKLPTTPAADGAALALHRVTIDLRSQYPSRPDLWAPLIHSGP